MPIHGQVLPGMKVWMRVSKERVPGVVLGLEQLGRWRGQWCVRNLATGHIVHRTARRLEVRNAEQVDD